MISANDVATPEAVVESVYRLLSGPADEPRDWEGLAALCIPGARLLPVSVHDGAVIVEAFDIEAYAQSREPIFATSGFYERELERRVEVTNNIAHVWSRYEARHSPNEPPFMRGTNSIQLVERGQRWWIVSAIWQAEQVAPNRN